MPTGTTHEEVSMRIKAWIAILWAIGLALLLSLSWAWPADALILNWQPSDPNALEYEIERCMSTDGNPCTTFDFLIRLGPVTTYTDPNNLLQPAMLFCYRLRGFNTTSQSDFSNVACATAPGLAQPVTPQLTIVVEP
jgi:hypothetical protein